MTWDAVPAACGPWAGSIWACPSPTPCCWRFLGASGTLILLRRYYAQTPMAETVSNPCHAAGVLRAKICEFVTT